MTTNGPFELCKMYQYAVRVFMIGFEGCDVILTSNGMTEIGDLNLEICLAFILPCLTSGGHVCGNMFFTCRRLANYLEFF